MNKMFSLGKSIGRNFSYLNNEVVVAMMIVMTVILIIIVFIITITIAITLS
jgi:hypothetical protein